MKCNRPTYTFPHSLRTIAACLLVTTLTIAHPTYASSNETKAQKPIRILMQDVGKQMARSTGSFYQELWAALSNGTPSYTIDIVPLLRKDHLFRGDKNSCMYPAHQLVGSSTQLSSMDVVQTKPFGKIHLRVYSPAGKPLVSSWEDLDGKILAVPPKYTMANPLLDIPVQAIEVSDAERRIDMLERGRVDAILGHSPLTELIMQEKGITEPRYDPAFLLAETSLVVMCHANEKTREFIAAIDKNIMHSRTSGYADHLLQKYGFNPDEFLPKLEIDQKKP